MAEKLVLQSNGLIVLETRGDRFVRSSAALNLIFRLEYRLADGSWKALCYYRDDMTARQCLREANKGFYWRLVASNEVGELVLPRRWDGYYR